METPSSAPALVWVMFSDAQFGSSGHLFSLTMPVIEIFYAWCSFQLSNIWVSFVPRAPSVRHSRAVAPRFVQQHSDRCIGVLAIP